MFKVIAFVRITTVVHKSWYNMEFRSVSKELMSKFLQEHYILNSEYCTQYTNDTKMPLAILR